MSEAPVFVVVGHVNRGKSSVVSTLAADDSVAIDRTPGTTQQCRAYPMRVDGEVLYTLVDTPGFERARHVLAWLREHETSTAERRATVRRFVDTFAGRGEYAQECALLAPILEGAAILYVVDASIPFSPSAEAETEILRWTGRPRMALMNLVGEEDHTESWRPVLEQYFSVVRLFDAHEADFEGRIGLLRTLRELDDEWRPGLDRAIEVLTEDRRQALRASAEAIADGLIDMLTHVESQQLSPEEDPALHRDALAERFYDALRAREGALRARLRSVYAHRSLAVLEPELETGEEDLFDLSTWSKLGLSRLQLAGGGGAAGAAIGGTIDAAVGGASLLLGSLIGGAAGAASSWWAFDRLAEVKVLGSHLAGPLLKIGPLSNPAFPWVVLGRALRFQRIVSTRAHAKRAAVETGAGEAEAAVSELPGELRRRLDQGFDRLRKKPRSTELVTIRSGLVSAIEAALEKGGP